MAQVRTFVIQHEGKEPFTIASIFARKEMARLLTECEEELGRHHTLNVVPEFPQNYSDSTMISFCKDGKVIALHCIATF